MRMAHIFFADKYIPLCIHFLRWIFKSFVIFPTHSCGKGSLYGYCGILGICSQDTAKYIVYSSIQWISGS